MNIDPSQTSLADRLAALSPAQRALFEKALRDKEVAQAQPPAPPARTIPRRPPGDICPISIDQERLWFIQQLNLDSPLFNIYSATRFRGQLSVTAMRLALNESVRRHEILRTTFPAIDGKPVQQIAPRLEVGIPLIDLRGLSEHRREAEGQRIAAWVVGTAHRLDRLPLFRMFLIQTADEDFIWPVCIHHIITDWVSYYAFEHEIQVLYEALIKGQPSPLPEVEVQFGDYAAWQRKRLDGPGNGLDDQLAYWRKRLDGAPTLMQLPTDRQRPAVQSPWGARRRVSLSPAVSEGVRAMARREGMTLFTAVLALFKALLVRLSNQEKLIVGTPLAYRTAPELKDTLGFFLNQLVLYSDLSGNPPFTEVLARVRETALGAYSHQDVPFAKLVEELRPERDLSRTPYTQVVLLLLNPYQQRIEAAGGLGAVTAQTAGGDAKSPLQGYWVDALRTQFDINFCLWEHPTGLGGFMEYNSDLWDAATIDRWKEHFRSIVTALVADPSCPFWDVPIIPEAQRHQILSEWGVGQPEDPSALLIHELFARQAQAAPQAVAARFGGRDLTYGELAARAAVLAGRLRAAGVGPDQLVAVCLPRGFGRLAGILGTLMAGGCYVALDPTTPAARLHGIIEDAAPRALLVPAEQRGDFASLPAAAAGAAAPLPAAQRLQILGLDQDGALAPEPPGSAPAGSQAGHPEGAEGAPALRPLPDHLAYGIFTSGSTGRPKGVLVSHRALVHLMRSSLQHTPLAADCRVLQFSSTAFDVSVWETWAALASGGRLVVPDRETRLSGVALSSLMRGEGVTHAFLTPSVLAAMPEEELPELRVLCAGGEAISSEVGARWSRGRRLLNCYGPAEATVYATMFHFPESPHPSHREPPIGRPVEGVRAYVVDLYGGLAPMGVAGELCLAGVGLARGYLGRPELTAESFLPDPFSGLPGGRLYRTGDLARLLSEGCVEFLGRRDHQVKVRGFRIELGEVEAALNAQPGVREAVVVARDQAGIKRLAAYVVPHSTQQPGGGELSQQALKDALKLRLPDYMVPATVSILAAFPLDASGKVNRAALPEPETPAVSDDATPAANAIEEKLARIWAEVLRVPKVGWHDNFFSLGGDSILSIQVITRAHAAGIHLTPYMMFRHQTVAELAAVANTMQSAAAEQGPVIGAAPLTPVQHWFLDSDPVDPDHFNLSVLLATAERLEAAPLAAALATLEEHHDVLRLRVRRRAAATAEAPALWEQVIEPPAGAGEAAPATLLDLSALPAASQPAAVEAAAEQAQASLDLDRGPIHRPLQIDLGAGQPGRFLWVIHHLAMDAVSWRVLLEDLGSAYAQVKVGGGQRAQLLPKTTSFKRWGERLAEHAGSTAVRGELGFWRGLPWQEVRPLPRDLQPGQNGAPGEAGRRNLRRSERAASASLTAEETRALLQDVPQTYNTRINDALLTALARAFQGWTGSPVLLVDLEGHGREPLFSDADLTRTVGWFTTIHPVLLDLRGHGQIGDALKAIKEQLRQVPSGGVGFGLLRYGQGGELARLPLPEVSFNYLGQLDGAVAGETPFAFAPEGSGSLRSPRAERDHVLAVQGSVAGGQMHLSCSWSTDLHHEATAVRLVEGLAGELRAIIAHCRNPEAGGFTPSDFSAARLSQKELDSFLGKLGKKKGK